MANLWWSYISCAVSLQICIRISFSSFKFPTFFSFLKKKYPERWKPWILLFANQNIIFSFFITQKSLFLFNSFLYPERHRFCSLFPFSQKICLHLTASFVYAKSDFVAIIYVPSLCFSSATTEILSIILTTVGFWINLNGISHIVDWNVSFCILRKKEIHFFVGISVSFWLILKRSSIH